MTIGKWAFEQCKSLESISLPSTLETLEGGAFAWCDALSSVSVRAVMPPSLGEMVFYLDPITILYVPLESLEAYKNSDWAQWFYEISTLD